MPCRDKHKRKDMEGFWHFLSQKWSHILASDSTCASKDCRLDHTRDFQDLQLMLRTLPNLETVHDVMGILTRLCCVLDHLALFLDDSFVYIISKERHEGKEKVSNRLHSFLESVFKNGASKSSCAVCESVCREGKSDSRCIHQTPDSVCEHCDCGVSWKHLIFTMIISQNTLGYSVNSTATLKNPKFPDQDTVICKHETHNIMQQNACVKWDAGLCMEKSLWLLEEKRVMEKKVRKRVVLSVHFLSDIGPPFWIRLLGKTLLPKWADITTLSCKYESCCSREMSERAGEVPVTSSGDTTGIQADKMLCDVIQLGIRSSNSDKVVKEEEMDHTQFQDQSLHMLLDEPQFSKQLYQLLNGPDSEKRHDSDESSVPGNIACTSNPTSSLCTSIDCTHMEMWNAEPLTCSGLEGMPTVPGPERSLLPQNERGPCLLCTPEEDRTQSCEDTLVNNADFQISTNLPYCHGTDERSKKSMELDAECLLFRVTTKSKCDADETEKLPVFIKMEEEESTEKLGAFIKTEGEWAEKTKAFVKTEQEEESRLVPWPSPYSKEEKEENDKESKGGKKENVDDVNYYSWMWQGPNICPRFSNIVVAMLDSPPSKMDFHHSGMENEWNRLKSYNLFTPPRGIFVLRLASAGFFLHTGGEGKTPEQVSVKCAFCGVVISIVAFIMKVVVDVHREWSPSCRFVRGEDVGNVSATQITERSSKEFLQELDSSFPSFGKSPPPPNAAVVAAPAGFQAGKVDLAVDCCPDPTTTVDRAPLQPRGLSLPGCGGPVSGNGWIPPLTNPEQPARPAVVASASVAASSAAAAATAAATAATASSSTSQRQEPNRPAASVAFALQTAAGGSNPVAQAPRQTATVQQPQTGTATHQPAGDTSSSSSPSSASLSATASAADRPPASQPANPPAVSASGSNVALPPAAGVGGSGGVVDSVSGGTAHQEAPQVPPAPPVSGSNVGTGRGSGDRIGSEDGRPQDRQLVTYDELGIFTQQPKRPDMVVKSVRVNTFERWPHTESHPAEEMAEAGFYYTGHEDLVRCFHCKGGLKTWERSDKPWVEHSRWFPRCPFVRLAKGPKFVDAVQKLNNPQTRPAISEEDVEREIRRMEDEERLGLTSGVTLLSAIPPPSPDSDPTLGPLARAALRIDADITEASLTDMAEQLVDENEEMRDSIRCKMCRMNNVNVLFLPCGHLVACTQCAPALRRCAMCRAAVKGSVHVYMDDCHGNRDSNTGTGNQGTATS